jgi:uncharacterized membrane protein
MRGTSAALSLLLIPAVFWLAWELFEDSATAWIAAALAACSPMHLLYAQEARQYALWTALTAAASAALLHASREGGARGWILYGVLITLGLYTHLLFVLVLVAHGAYLLFSLRRSRCKVKEVLSGWGLAVIVAVLMFSPWIMVVVSRAHSVEAVTAWMERPVPVERQLQAWGVNLVRTFADSPGVEAFLLLGLIPLSWILWRFCVRAPLAARLLICTLFLTFVAAVLVPDVIQGGRRSLHPRYALPSFLAVELAAAYVLASGWSSPSTVARIGWRAGLILVLGLGVGSGWLILQADTWWSKNFSAANREVAGLINATERPLLIVTDSSVGLGEAISVAYDLGDQVVIKGEPRGGGGVSTNGFSDIFLLTPSAELRAALSGTHDLKPLLNTWQWFRAVPKSRGEES